MTIRRPLPITCAPKRIRVSPQWYKSLYDSAAASWVCESRAAAAGQVPAESLRPLQHREHAAAFRNRSHRVRECEPRAYEKVCAERRAIASRHCCIKKKKEKKNHGPFKVNAVALLPRHEVHVYYCYTYKVVVCAHSDAFGSQPSFILRRFFFLLPFQYLSFSTFLLFPPTTPSSPDFHPSTGAPITTSSAPSPRRPTTVRSFLTPKTDITGCYTCAYIRFARCCNCTIRNRITIYVCILLLNYSFILHIILPP